MWKDRAMKYRLVKVGRLSGRKAAIYTIAKEGESRSFFERFLGENLTLFKSEIESILVKLETIGHRTGARPGFFKEFEGAPGDGVCALYDEPDSKLRLYCIRFGQDILILGGGGPKGKQIRSFQEDKKLREENYFLRWASAEISQKIKEKDFLLRFHPPGIEGDLFIETDEEKDCDE